MKIEAAKPRRRAVLASTPAQGELGLTAEPKLTGWLSEMPVRSGFYDVLSNEPFPGYIERHYFDAHQGFWLIENFLRVREQSMKERGWTWRGLAERPPGYRARVAA